MNFGTGIYEGLISKEIHYLQSIASIQRSSFVASTPTRGLKVVFGSGVDISFGEHGNKIAVNGTQLDNLKKTGEAFIDKNGKKYIDFAAVFAKLRSESNVFSSNEQTPGIRINFANENDRMVDVSGANIQGTGSVRLKKTNEDGTKTLPNAKFKLYKKPEALIKAGLKTDGAGELVVDKLASGDYFFREIEAPGGYEAIQRDTSFSIPNNALSSDYIYLSLKRADLEKSTPIKITGLSKNKPSVIVNVDMQGKNDIHINSKIILVIDGRERNCRETDNFQMQRYFGISPIPQGTYMSIIPSRELF